MAQDLVVEPIFCQRFPGPGFLFGFRAAPRRPHAPPLPAPEPLGPSGIVTGGLHSGGKFWVAPGGVLATPSKQQGIPTSRMGGGGSLCRATLMSDTNLCVSMRTPCMAQCHGWGKDWWWSPTRVPQLQTYPW